MEIAAIVRFARMNLQIDKLAFLITDLLDATRIEAGQFKYHKSSFNFNSLVKEIVSEMQFVRKRIR